MNLVTLRSANVALPAPPAAAGGPSASRPSRPAGPPGPVGPAGPVVPVGPAAPVGPAEPRAFHVSSVSLPRHASPAEMIRRFPCGPTQPRMMPSCVNTRAPLGVSAPATLTIAAQATRAAPDRMFMENLLGGGGCGLCHSLRDDFGLEREDSIATLVTGSGAIWTARFVHRWKMLLPTKTMPPPLGTARRPRAPATKLPAPA